MFVLFCSFEKAIQEGNRELGQVRSLPQEMKTSERIPNAEQRSRVEIGAAEKAICLAIL